jgi:hypothetical protein
LFLPGRKEASIRARTIRLGDRAEWKLSDGEINYADGTVEGFRSAILSISGTNAGAFSYVTTNATVRVHLPSVFSCEPSKRPKS